MVHKNPAALIEPPHQRVISAATPVTSPSTTFSQLLNMESAESSPERQTAQQSHEELLQAFQSFKPARRGPSKTPQPLSTSRPQRSSTPATNTSQTTSETSPSKLIQYDLLTILLGAGITAFQQDSLSTAASTQDTTTTTTRKRARRASYMEQTGENESSDSDAPLSQALKRPRQSPSEASVQPTDVSSTKQASTVPKHVVEVQIHNRLAHLEKVASRTLKYIDSTIQEEQGRASITPEVAATSTEGIQGQSMDGALQGQNPATIFAPQTTQSSINFATQLLNENQACSTPFYYCLNIVAMSYDITQLRKPRLITPPISRSSQNPSLKRTAPFCAVSPLPPSPI
jgi:hypothetical protein